MAAANKTLRQIIDIHAHFYFLCQGHLASFNELKNTREKFLQTIDKILQGETQCLSEIIEQVRQTLEEALAVNDGDLDAELYTGMHGFFRDQADNSHPFPEKRLMINMLGIQDDPMITQLYSQYCSDNSDITLVVSDFGEVILQGQSVSTEHPSKRNQESVLPRRIHPGRCLLSQIKFMVMFNEDINCFLDIGPFPFLFLISSRALNIAKGSVLPLFHHPGLWMAPRNTPAELILGAHQKNSGPIFDFSGDSLQLLAGPMPSLRNGGFFLGSNSDSDSDSDSGSSSNNDDTGPNNSPGDGGTDDGDDTDADDTDNDAHSESEMWCGPLHDPEELEVCQAVNTYT